MDHIRLIVLFTLVYIVLRENFTLSTVILGMLAGGVAIWLTNKILDIDYVEMFHIDLWLILTYFWIIVRDTYVSGFAVIIRMFKGEIKPNFVDYHSNLNDEFLTVLLANAITMPPGAITVDRDGDDMSILTVGYKEEEFRKATYDGIEKLLKKFDSPDQE